MLFWHGDVHRNTRLEHLCRCYEERIAGQISKAAAPSFCVICWPLQQFNHSPCKFHQQGSLHVMQMNLGCISILYVHSTVLFLGGQWDGQAEGYPSAPILNLERWILCCTWAPTSLSTGQTQKGMSLDVKCVLLFVPILQFYQERNSRVYTNKSCDYLWFCEWTTSSVKVHEL